MRTEYVEIERLQISNWGAAPIDREIKSRFDAVLLLRSTVNAEILNAAAKLWPEINLAHLTGKARCEDTLEPKAALAPRTAVRNFLTRLIAREGSTAGFSDSDSLLLSGRLQSVDGVEIVVFLEEQYGLDFAAMGFDMAKIDTVDSIAALIESTRKSA